MSSAICQNFVQNAWKKELCSNCFKSKDEHAERPKLKPITLISSKIIEGIIKNGTHKRKKPKRTVMFHKKLSEIIGYGGEDWASDNDDDNDDECAKEVDGDDDDTEDDDFIVESSSSEDEETVKELKRITKANTDFNTTSLNENYATETNNNNNNIKKSYAQLLLGKPVVDSEGRKQTLLVQVTPFGEETGPPKKLPSSSSSSSHIPIANKIMSTNSKETLVETKSNVVLTAYTKNDDELKTSTKIKTEEKSLLDEITETLENGKNPIQIISRKKSQKEIVLLPIESNKENQESVVVKTEKRSSLTRTPALKRDIIEKPVVTSTAKIELLNTKNTKLNNETTKKQIKGLPPQIPKYQNVVFPQTREQAGEPDGRADPDVLNEPPALPLTPPPNLENQTSFLHHDKPKIPSKPSSATVLIRKQPVHNFEVRGTTQILTTFSPDPNKNTPSPLLTKQDSNASDLSAKIANKRRAPKPPPEELMSVGVYVRHSAIAADSPVAREKEKRERASSCSPKNRIISDNPQGSGGPEPAPRKSLSISTDSLNNNSGADRKEKTKGRFSLKKFLRMGSNKDLPKIGADHHVTINTINKQADLSIADGPPQPKPRLVIVHPSELNGDRVEVVAKSVSPDVVVGTTNLPDYSNVIHNKAHKPPPPPRNLDDWNRSPKPNLPPPPKSVDIVNKQKLIGRNVGGINRKVETVYANIGEVRSAIVPNKPVRTASMREREAQLQMIQQRKISDSYEPINLHKNDGENLYDYINNSSTRSSSPDSEEQNSPNSKLLRLNKRSESSIDVSSGDYFKYNNNNNIPRSLSLTYCGSETESEIYAPYSFYGSESEVTEDDHDWIQNGRTQKLRSRKGRSIVHKNLEDNYGAVIVANHEALAQVLENIQQSVHVQPALRGLKTLSNLRWTDFTLIEGGSISVGRRVFYQALWGSQHVTLAVSCGSVPASTHSLGNLSLTPITEFSDLIPNSHLTFASNKDSPVQASVAVLPWTQINTIETYSEALKNKTTITQEELWKESSFVMLQLVNALKTLQAQGIEDLPVALTTFVLCKEIDKDVHHRLYVLQGLGEEIFPGEKYGTLCTCALKAQELLQPVSKISSLVQSLLSNERAVSLTQVKSVLEFSLWGPSDVALGCTVRERELALQRWLDLQRATVLHGLVCTRVQLTIQEEYHLLFFVRTNAKMMSEASILLEASTINGKKILRK